jgi:FlaA1/EpsC-like NDP-sugar epimerase
MGFVCQLDDDGLDNTSIEAHTCYNNKIDLYNVLDKDFSTKLLERNTTPRYSLKAKKLIKDKTILVTGAGGSIGSEITRQLIRLKAKKVYCIDNDEYALYRLSLDLNGNALLTDDNIILADIKDKISISRIFAQINPDIVYHAAAHKHLPLLEISPVAAINTNVLGTDNIAAACVKYGVKYFVNVSTDKAASPVSVLGMTKRLAELCTAGYKNAGITKVASVRFGNVLGSRGSFLPTLIWQIENSKPITVTHPDVSRFFMSIPEAAALVIEASALSSGGETYVLDMGKPVRIMDLIDRYVNITGCRYPNITYIGLRPGEKLHEDLFDPTEICAPTIHPRIIQTKVEQSGMITYKDKMQLRYMINIKITPDELKNKLKWLMHEIENRQTLVKEQEQNIIIGTSRQLSESIQ